MNGPGFTIFDDYLNLVARERQTALMDEAARRRAARNHRDTTDHRDTGRTRSRFLRWH